MIPWVLTASLILKGTVKYNFADTMDDFRYYPMETYRIIFIYTVSRSGYWLSKTRNNPALMKQQKYKTFFAEHKEYFMSPVEKWNDNFERLKDYIEEHHKLPSGANKDDNIRYLGKWAGTQKRIFGTKTQIMKNQMIYNSWKSFITENEELFQ